MTDSLITVHVRVPTQAAADEVQTAWDAACWGDGYTLDLAVKEDVPAGQVLSWMTDESHRLVPMVNPRGEHIGAYTS